MRGRMSPMKVPISAVLACMLPMGASLWAQPPEHPAARQTDQIPGASAPAPTAGQQSELQGDRFAQVRDRADQLKAAYEDLDASNMKEIDKLALTKVCQIRRVGPLLDRTIVAMHEWLTTERTYWQIWNDRENERIDGQKKDLAGYEEDQARLDGLIDEEKKNQEKLEQERATLDNSGKRTEETTAQIDTVSRDIRDSQARLAHAQQQYKDVTDTINNLSASLGARIVNIRQNLVKLDAWELDQKAFYESKRTAAQEVCSMKQPSPGTPLPKSGGK